ncbi:hydroxyisourate hydrolase [Spongiactinospora sp. TRM90649]|uniref:hydroxyisourate hydrolase n=1 Tax=Spongiactinospora sp. TRM90649 TaxID=3031114 RepID=UPI0023FA49B1|nr:hydroxyisourate hydrolase [Spongiactinospora sp. TRM90649]MDF5756773.1 hydroxyisourate hydrolase [Spongiactinospora sp. TRM90649]
MSLSTHVLDASIGRPAEGIAVRLESRDGVIDERRTDAEGRVGGWKPGRGVHRLVFETGHYFAGRGMETFYPEATVTFTVADPDAHYHVPLLLSPFAYTTYRGS